MADDWLPVVTGHVIEARSSLHDDGEAVLVALRVVGLAGAPPVLGCRPPAGPADAPGGVVDSAASPEVGLALPGQQAGELPLLGGAVQGHGGHPVGLTVGGALAGCEGGAAQPPGDQVLGPPEGVVGSTVTTSSSSSSSSHGLCRSPSTTGTTRPAAQAADEVRQTSEETLTVDTGQAGGQDKADGQCWSHDAKAKYNQHKNCYLSCGSTPTNI